MRIVFFGTPDFAVPSLEILAAQHDVALVVAQPDRPAGRGMKLQSPPVASKAKTLGLPLLQPEKIRTDAFLETIRDAAPELGIVVAYGRILPAALLEIPRRGFLNVHGSILPRWRGAAPIQRAVEAGERVAGVSIMHVDEQLDHGAVYEIATLDVAHDERMPHLAARLAILGAEALARVVDAIEQGTAVVVEQQHELATHAAKIEKSEGRVDWSVPAQTIYDRFRAFDPWPGLFIETTGEQGVETLKLGELAPTADRGAAGTILGIDAAGVVVATGDGAIRIGTMQRPGKTRAAAADVARALGWRIGTRLS